MVLSYLQDGWTPLFSACEHGHLPVVEHLMGAKADVNYQKKVSYHYTFLVLVTMETYTSTVTIMTGQGQ